MPSPITEEEELLIIKMWKERATGSEIGAALGRSRNSIMGKLNRLRAKGVITLLPEGEARFKPKNKEQSPPPVVKKKVPSMPKMPPLKTKADLGEPKPLESLFTAPPVKEEKRQPIKFSALKPRSCRYVVSGKWPEDFLFCGKTKTQAAYCDEHAKISYVKVEKRRPNPVDTFKLEKMSGFMHK